MKFLINDEIITEFPAIRVAHAAKFNYDLDAIYEDINLREAEHPTRGGKFVDPLAPTSGITQSDYQKIGFGKLLGQI
ncbi:MAG: hypothetical protein ACOYMG_12865 [Candidatus Methylumidiphilus sp.]